MRGNFQTPVATMPPHKELKYFVYCSASFILSILSMMSLNTPSTAIHTLNDDILMLTFELNGDMFTDVNALATTRTTAQVCWRWRGLLLETPSLWAKLIDMDELYKPMNREWKNELMQRTGDAPLWIRVEDLKFIDLNSDLDGPCDEDFDRFFYRVVESNWHRIEKIVIAHDSAFELTHTMLNFPAPLLQHIEAAPPCNYYYTQFHPENDARITPPFANHAPMLRHIYLDRDFVDPCAPWLHQIHSMTLNKKYRLPDALAVLSATSELQELKIQDIYAKRPDISRPTIPLLHLQRLEYRISDSRTTITLLDHVAIPVGCSLSIYFELFAHNRTLKYQKPFLLSTIDIFMQHVDCSLRSHTFDAIYLDYQENAYISWELRVRLPLTHHSLSILLPLTGDSDGRLLELFFTKVLQLDLTSSTFLSITTDCQSISRFELLFCQLSAVTTISTDVQTLSQLTSLQDLVSSNGMDKPSVVFPSLKIIKLIKRVGDPQEMSFVNEVIGTFILSRLRVGLPISTLDMSYYTPLETPLDLGEVTGLKVLYRV